MVNQSNATFNTICNIILCATTVYDAITIHTTYYIINWTIWNDSFSRRLDGLYPTNKKLDWKLVTSLMTRIKQSPLRKRSVCIKVSIYINYFFFWKFEILISKKKFYYRDFRFEIQHTHTIRKRTCIVRIVF